MKKYIKILMLGFLVLFLQIKLIIAAPPITAPDFQLQETHQDIITLSSYKDKQPLVLLFWKTSSPSCSEEIRVLNDIYAGLIKDGIEVLSIDVGELPNKVEDFIRSYNLAYRVLLDKDTTVAGRFGVTGYPTYVLINKSQDVVFKDNYFPYKDYKDLILK